ncbi:hypothetical protein SCHPADRAFT_897179 [Schizopora paradoxa]|uniref:Uncharacterized protein n=1 Tax=Schizopora paradoxa TaxID=27342 RepID=A0A0H2QXB4_9AGAM|nr:hypothetical protein SCHPADRAFT_897179 [Schizopora paradoxa]
MSTCCRRRPKPMLTVWIEGSRRGESISCSDSLRVDALTLRIGSPWCQPSMRKADRRPRACAGKSPVVARTRGRDVSTAREQGGSVVNTCRAAHPSFHRCGHPAPNQSSSPSRLRRRYILKALDVLHRLPRVMMVYVGSSRREQSTALDELRRLPEMMTGQQSIGVHLRGSTVLAYAKEDGGTCRRKLMDGALDLARATPSIEIARAEVVVRLLRVVSASFHITVAVLFPDPSMPSPNVDGMYQELSTRAPPVEVSNSMGRIEGTRRGQSAHA